MAKATVVITYPTTRSDGSALPTNRIGGAHVLRDGNIVGTVSYPSSTFDDPTDLAPGTYQYQASVFDTNPAVKEGDLSQAEAVTVVAVEAAPSAPTISVTVV
jgi:hypothetical protein